MKTKILDLARVIRSKNYGPYELVLDIMFKDRAIFQRLQASGQITESLIAKVYGVPRDKICRIIWFDPSNAVKVVMRRLIVSGSPGDSDVYGAQQHAPLLALEFDL